MEQKFWVLSLFLMFSREAMENNFFLCVTGAKEWKPLALFLMYKLCDHSFLEEPSCCQREFVLCSLFMYLSIIVLCLIVCVCNILQQGHGEQPKGALGGVIDTNFSSLEGLVKTEKNWVLKVLICKVHDGWLVFEFLG